MGFNPTISEEIVTNYKNAYVFFVQAADIIKEATDKLDSTEVDNVGNSYPLISWCIKQTMKVIDTELQRIIVPPERVASADKKRIITSIDFFNTMKIRMNRYWDKLLSDSGITDKFDPKQLSKLQDRLKTKLEDMEKELSKIPKEDLMMADPEEASDELGDYYQSLSDIDASSENFMSLTNLVKDNEKILLTDQGSASKDKLRNKIKSIGNIIEEKINLIRDRMTGLVAGFCTVLKDSLAELPRLVDAGKDVY